MARFGLMPSSYLFLLNPNTVTTSLEWEPLEPQAPSDPSLLPPLECESSCQTPERFIGKHAYSHHSQMDTHFSFELNYSDLRIFR